MIAFFDLDRTVLSCNSAQLWIRRQVRLGSLSRVGAARGAAWIGLYHLGFSRIESAIGEAVRWLEGREENDLRRQSEEFWHEDVAQHVRPGARQAIASHLDAGHELVLLTSSSVYLADVVARDLGFHGVLANRFEVRDGVFTGRPVEPLCYGPGKLVHARAYAEGRGVSLETCAFYTDSTSDLSVLEAVGRPVAVHPDPRLARIARSRAWPVVTWS